MAKKTEKKDVVKELKEGKKVDLREAQANSIDREGNPVSKSRTTRKTHVATEDLPEFFRLYVEKYGDDPRRVDLEVIHKGLWPSDDNQITITEYYDSHDFKQALA